MIQQSLSTYPKEMESVCCKDSYTPMFTAALFTKDRVGKNMQGNQLKNGQRK